MIITQTPYRVSLFGGGTDHPSWYKENGGSVVSFAIDKYSYINVRELPPFFEHKYRVSYSIVETVMQISDIKHPAVREGFKKFAPNLNLELHHHGDLPARSGVGSSSAFAVGLINALTALQGLTMNAKELADNAIVFEQKDLFENVGSQDQIACSLGGMNFIEFGTGEIWKAKSINISREYKFLIEQHAILLYSGIPRYSSDVSQTLLKNLKSKSREMKRTQEMALECKKIFENEGDLSLIGDMLMESWELKRRMNSSAVTAELEQFFEKGKKAGASGGKILGAGGGGFFLFWVDPNNRASFINKMAPAVTVPIKISDIGSNRLI